MLELELELGGWSHQVGRDRRPAEFAGMLLLELELARRLATRSA